MGPKIARYLRVSRKEQRKALDRQLFSLEQTVLKLGGSLEDSPLFIDLQSGRDSDRVEFQKLLRAVECKEIDIVVAYRVDRLARDLEVNARLGKLLESTGVRLFDFQRDAFVDFDNPEDWEAYAQKGVSAEAESRKLSKRISSGYEFARHRGKASSKPPWGYTRNPETEGYELNSDLAEAVRDSVKIILSERNFQQSCRLIAQKWGKQWQTNSLRKWISNPVLRGHTGYFHQGRYWGEIKFNTHLEQAVLTEEEYQAIESLIEERKQYWGVNAQSPRHPLGGLVACGRCGTKMCITMGYRAQDGHKNLYFSCRERVQRVKPDNVCDMRRSLKVEEAEEAVISELIKAREKIATLAQTPSKPVKTPKQLELENLLANLNKMGNNPLLQASKDQTRAEIARLQVGQRSVAQAVTENRDLLLSVFGSRVEWTTLKPDEKRLLFQALVNRVVVYCSDVETGELSRRGKPKIRVDWRIDVSLQPLGFPAETVHSSSEQ